MKNNNVDEWQTLQQFSRTVNHELRTPLVAIRTGVNAVKDYLPKLIEGYMIAQRNNLEVPLVQSRHIDALLRTLENVENEAYFAATYLNMLTKNLQTIDKSAMKLVSCSIKGCLKKALDDYPCHSNTQRQILQKIILPKDDFLFNSDENLTILVLMNLIKNSLYHIQDAGKGEITINIENQKNKNVLYFKDTGKSISDEMCLKIFEQGFSTQVLNMGCGLSFCRQVMQAINGEIICESAKEKYTQFKLVFPLLD